MVPLRVNRKLGHSVALLMALALFTGCASFERNESGHYQRLTFERVSPGGSLFDAISSAADDFQQSRENDAALSAHEGCRTNPVFDQYHVKHLYQSLQSHFADLGAALVHEQGYIFVALPMNNNLPDPGSLARLASVVGANEHIHVFLPNRSPFGEQYARDDLRQVRDKLARSGVGKDHILLLPLELFKLPPALTAVSSNTMLVKLCYS